MKHSIELWKTGTWYRLARFCMYLCMNKMKPTGPVVVVAVSRCQSWTRHTRPLGHRSSILLLLLLHTTVSPNVAPGLFPHDTTTTVASKLTYSQGLGSYVSRSGRVSYPPGPRASSVGAPTLTIDDIRDFRLLSVLCEKKGNFWKLPNMWTIFILKPKKKHTQN